DKDTVRLWRVENENNIKTDIALENPKSGASVAISPSGSMIACGSTADHQIHLWRTNDGRLIKSFRGHTAPVILISFNTDEKSLLSADQDGTVIVWQVDDGQILNRLTRPNQQIMGV